MWQCGAKIMTCCFRQQKLQIAGLEVSALVVTTEICPETTGLSIHQLL